MCLDVQLSTTIKTTIEKILPKLNIKFFTTTSKTMQLKLNENTVY